ncbi:MAG: hypothetical protein HQL32_09495 [Planctomycetes bacterium]|nr:hypothetical protein [Planctomycetota bacterium]
MRENRTQGSVRGAFSNGRTYLNTLNQMPLSLYRLLFETVHELPESESVFKIIGWWESYRIRYNVIVGVSGFANFIFSMSVLLLGNIIFEGSLQLPDPPLAVPLGIIVFGIMANICYTSGWIISAICIKTFKYSAFSCKSIFVFGSLFSIFITFIPSLLTILVTTLLAFRNYQ